MTAALCATLGHIILKTTVLL